MVLVFSGGLDSTVLAYWYRRSGAHLRLLSVDYGQRHRTELRYAAATAEALGAEHRIADLSGVRPLLGGSSLTDRGVGVPDGHYTDASMRTTVVPNRNALMLDVAVAHAVAVEANVVAFGAHTGDHAIYPDCRPAFLEAYGAMVAVANEGFLSDRFRVRAPFLALSKADIVAVGAGIGVPFADTWSCYRGGARHCGSCGTCVERREAFAVAGVADPTAYDLTAPRVR